MSFSLPAGRARPSSLPGIAGAGGRGLLARCGSPCFVLAAHCGGTLPASFCADMGFAFRLLLGGFAFRFFALRLVKFSRFSFGLSYLEAPASFNAMAIACRRLFTLPPFPSGPLLSSPCSYSCVTRPIVLRCRGDVLGISHLFRVFLSLSGPTPSRLPRFRPPTSRDRPRTEELATRRAVAMSQSKRGFDGI